MSRSRRLVVVWLLAFAVAATVTLTAAARSTSFRDEFTSFDANRWVVSSRPFGRGTLDPANVAVTNGFLGIELPGGTLNGGEMRSRSLFGFGTYRASIKVANAPSSLTAFFLYKRPDYQQEIDIELFNDPSGQVMFSTYSGGFPTNNQTVQLGFDPTTAFHVYEIDYEPGSVRFLVDGALLKTWTSGVPRSSMYLYFTAWFPSWLTGPAPAGDRFTYVDWVDFAAS